MYQSTQHLVLLVSANLFLLNLFLNLIEMVSHVAPCRRLHHHILAFLGAHINLGILILIKTDDPGSVAGTRNG